MRAGEGPAPAEMLIATTNPGKLDEIRALLEGAPARFRTLDEFPPVPEPEETGRTFAENALIKARAAAGATGGTALADDSGIAAEALGGAPGVYSARYAGEGATDAENLAKLLRQAPAGSPVAYVCALAFVDPADGTEHVVEARCEGTLAAEPRGDGGFGYDPAFVPVEHPDRTMAELTEEEKGAISHRGRAARELRAWLARR